MILKISNKIDNISKVKKFQKTEQSDLIPGNIGRASYLIKGLEN
jgi:RNA-splicing ligase RtcB